MTETPEQIASRLMHPAGDFALWTYDQVKALIIRAVEEERAREGSIDQNGRSDSAK